ncbi:MAG: hypothetical protein P8163_03955 [Candidatus Thiodiazotropha sp.]
MPGIPGHYLRFRYAGNSAFDRDVRVQFVQGQSKLTLTLDQPATSEAIQIRIQGAIRKNAFPFSGRQLHDPGCRMWRLRKLGVTHRSWSGGGAELERSHTALASIEDQAVIDKILCHLQAKGILERASELLPAARASPDSDWFVWLWV